MKKYQLIYADPPWSWKARSEKGEGRSAKNHYPVMETQEIADLPISSLAADRSVLMMWVIDTMLEDAWHVINAWGFKRITVAYYWIKLNPKALTPFIGTGYYTRANPEQCWLATRRNGKRALGLPVMDHKQHRLIVTPEVLVTPIGEHSEKPVEAYERTEALFGDVSRLELFARKNRPGWDAWGNQAPVSIALSS